LPAVAGVALGNNGERGLVEGRVWLDAEGWQVRAGGTPGKIAILIIYYLFDITL